MSTKLKPTLGGLGIRLIAAAAAAALVGLAFTAFSIWWADVPILGKVIVSLIGVAGIGFAMLVNHALIWMADGYDIKHTI